MNNHKIIAVLISLLISNITVAQDQTLEESLSENSSFAAVVQYIEGSAMIQGASNSLVFKSIIKNKDIIEVSAKSHLKVITQNRCVGVVYGPAKLVAPEDKSSPWEIFNSELRWICPEEKIEKLKISGAELKIQNGEIFFDKKMLYVFTDSVFSAEKKLDIQKIYGVNKGKFLPFKKQPSALEVWNKDRSFKLPKESSRWRSARPENPSPTRIFIQPHIGLGGIHDWDHDRDITDQDYKITGVRFGTNFLVKKKYSIYAFIEHSESENSDARHEYFGPIQPGYNSIRFKNSILGLGLRHSHTESSSAYYYVGFSKQEVEASIYDDYSYNISMVYKSNLVLGLGYQYILFPKNWISIVLGLEGRVIQSLYQGSIRNASSYSFGADPIDPRGHLMNYSLSLYLGPSLNF